MRNYPHPLARKEELVIQEADNEVLIYDLRENRAYCLNQTSAMIWEACDGTKDADAIATEVGKKLREKVTGEMVDLGLGELSRNGLVMNAGAGVNRREAIRRIGIGSLVAIPVVTSLLAPKAWAQGSQPAPVCLTCSKKTEIDCTDCGDQLGNCYSNAGCGQGLFLTNVTCAQCFAQPDPGPGGGGTISWKGNPV
jgi:hypothetical protein